MDKRCFRCGLTKDIEEFYRHPMMADGRLGKCKACTRRDVRNNRESKRDYYNMRDRERYRAGPKREQVDRSQRKHPTRCMARKMVNVRVARGTMKRGPCEVCGTTEGVQGHHDDYSKPLEVRWLCRKHHMELHRMPD